MFSADLSWTDPDTEKVGERRERLAREKERSESSASCAASVKSASSSRSSIAVDGELWWATSLRKAKNIKPIKKLNLRPDSSRSAGHSRSASGSLPINLELDTSDSIKDPSLQPGWTYATCLSPTLPSGASLDPPEYEVPELEGDFSSRCTNSSGSRSSHEGKCKSPGHIKVIDEVHEVQQLSPTSYVARTIRIGTESAELPQEPGKPRSPKGKKKLYSVRIEGCLDLEALQLQNQSTELATSSPQIEKHPSYASGLNDRTLVAWRPPSDWDVLLPNPLDADLRKSLPPLPREDELAMAAEIPLELTRFQRFIRRMESAGPKIILDRVKEEWHNPVDLETGDEMMLEKQLWVLTAFQLQNLGRYSRFPRTHTGKILELYGNLSEVYQLSAMYPRENVHYLSTQPQQAIPLPSNVSYQMVDQPGLLPLPYPDASFSHIRASTLPSLIPSAKLPLVFQECYRLLAPGGMLEIRIMDAAPLRKTAGPKMKAWIEDRLSLNLERLFRCSKPCTLIPSWVTDAGFDLPITHPSEGEQNMQLPCAYETSTADVDAELAMLDVPDEPRWWWEDEEVMRECLERKTVFECGAIFAFKN
ncbi:hypothetical protein B0J11DRAFT_548914 [Dendryphion nanum]|uniref:Methyltransferase type 11 domain-containing protein n=1 Tax=Dendryphion nanum TaxID=256645 RepID=A0A9P9E4X1_9PLEO|nr:hypothetical protein B0J11DRAFT_548914 [Dendryphion nanum]